MKNLNEPTKRNGNFGIGDSVEVRGFFNEQYANGQRKLSIINGVVKKITNEKVLISYKKGEVLVDSYKVSKIK